jgi:hypothetical protein
LTTVRCTGRNLPGTGKKVERMKIMLKSRDLILLASYFWFLVFLTIVSWTYPFQAALFPRILLVAGYIVAGIELWKKLSRKEALKRRLEAAGHVEPSPKGLRRDGVRIGVYATCGFLYVALLDTLGYILTQFLIMGLLMNCLGLNWKTTLGLAIGTALGGYLVFAVGLELPLPKGVLEKMLF